MMAQLRKLNERLIEVNINDKIQLRKYKLIQKILSDDKCFFKMNIEQAYSILRDLGLQENDLKKIYMELIDVKNY